MPKTIFDRFEDYYDEITDLENRRNPHENTTKGERMTVACRLLELELLENRNTQFDNIAVALENLIHVKIMDRVYTVRV